MVVITLIQKNKKKRGWTSTLFPDVCLLAQLGNPDGVGFSFLMQWR